MMESGYGYRLAKPIRRKDENDQVFKTRREKYNAVISKIEEAHAKGQPVFPWLHYAYSRFGPEQGGGADWTRRWGSRLAFYRREVA